MAFWTPNFWKPGFWKDGFWSGLVSPLTGYVMTGAQIAQAAGGTGQMYYPLPPTRVLQNLNTKGRSIGWDTVVRMAEGPNYQARKPYPVYVFGGGQVRRIFTQDV